MDKQTLLDMGFCGNYKVLEYSTKQKDCLSIFAEKKDGKDEYEFMLEADLGAYVYPLTINTKFDLEQLLKILGE